MANGDDGRRIPPEFRDDPGRPVTSAELIGSTISASVRRLLRHEDGVRFGDDPEDVHQFRVATRRLRSDLRTFAWALDPGWVKTTIRRLRWLAREVGRVRDADVLTQRLERQARALPPGDADSTQLLMRRLHRETDAARASLREALTTSQYADLATNLTAAADRPPFTSDEAHLQRPARGHVEQDMLRQCRRLEHTVSALPPVPSDAELHGVRIAAKRCRYAVEAAAPVLGEPASRLASAVAELQGLLGDHHDAVVAEAWLRQAAAAEPAAAVTAGELVARQRAEADRLRAHWREVWRGVKVAWHDGWPQAN